MCDKYEDCLLVDFCKFFLQSYPLCDKIVMQLVVYYLSKILKNSDCVCRKFCCKAVQAFWQQNSKMLSCFSQKRS